jgi:hypothetical protein
MSRQYRIFVAECLSDLADQAVCLSIDAPTYSRVKHILPHATLDSQFFTFTEGLRRFRPQLGETLFRKLFEMCDEARACFEADPDRTTGETDRGKQLILDVEAMIEEVRIREWNAAHPNGPRTIWQASNPEPTGGDESGTP